MDFSKIEEYIAYLKKQDELQCVKLRNYINLERVELLFSFSLFVLAYQSHLSGMETFYGLLSVLLLKVSKYYFMNLKKIDQFRKVLSIHLYQVERLLDTARYDKSSLYASGIYGANHFSEELALLKQAYRLDSQKVFT